MSTNSSDSKLPVGGAPKSPPASAGRRQTGEWVSSKRGLLTFCPYPLHPQPPQIRWDNNLVTLISRADNIIGKLAGEARRLPNHHVFIRPFMRSEAVFSSRIEGTVSTLQDILTAEIDPKNVTDPEDIKEIQNYIRALELGWKRVDTESVTSQMILDLHRVLMTGVRGGRKGPGTFRQEQNWIGPEGCNTPEKATYLPPAPEFVSKCMDDWIKFANDTSLPPLIQAGIAHYQFEAIHPFLDGNGRVGRLLIMLLLARRKVLPLPLLYLSAYFERNRPQYYKSLKDITDHGYWEEWLTFFLDGVERQGRDALERARNINDLLHDWRQRLASESSPLPLRLLDRLADNPFLKSTDAPKFLGVSYNAGLEAVRKLEKHRILTLISMGQRNRMYRATELFNIINSPSEDSLIP
jgi:Fic family protein